MKKTLMLMNAETDLPVAENLIKATSPISRAIGLLGRKSIAQNSGLYFPRCRSIHTHFMMFPIDVVCLDNELTVTEVFPEVKPWKLILSRNKASRHTIELVAGRAKETDVTKGTKLAIVDK